MVRYLYHKNTHVSYICQRDLLASRIFFKSLSEFMGRAMPPHHPRCSGIACVNSFPGPGRRRLCGIPGAGGCPAGLRRARCLWCQGGFRRLLFRAGSRQLLPARSSATTRSCASVTSTTRPHRASSAMAVTVPGGHRRYLFGGIIRAVVGAPVPQGGVIHQRIPAERLADFTVPASVRQGSLLRGRSSRAASPAGGAARLPSPLLQG